MGWHLNKPVMETVSSDEANGNLNVGASSMQEGWPKHHLDAHNVLLDFGVNASLFAVYDGDGGHEVAVYCSQELPSFIKDTEAYKNRNFERALEDAFLGFDATLTSPEVIAKLQKLRSRRTAECSATSSNNAESSTNLATASVSPDTSKPVEEKAGGDQPNQNGQIKQSAKGETPTEVEIPQENGKISKKGKDIEEEGEDCDMNKTEWMARDVGCTAIVALLHENKLYVANAGHSLCIVCRNGKAVEMSIVHDPEDEQERKRVMNAGGNVTKDGFINGNLILSRAIGNHRYKRHKDLSDREQMITALPGLRTLTINHTEDEFMVLASDGIRNSMSSQEVVDFIRPRIQESPEKLSEICEEMFEHCLSPSSFVSKGCDNMTAIIVQFKMRGSPRSNLRDKRLPLCNTTNTATNCLGNATDCLGLLRTTPGLPRIASKLPKIFRAASLYFTIGYSLGYSFITVPKSTALSKVN